MKEMNKQEINNKFADILDRKENKNKSAVEIVVEQDLEIERLNNILNELENVLRELIFGSNNLNHSLTAQIILFRLKELKGEDK